MNLRPPKTLQHHPPATKLAGRRRKRRKQTKKSDPEGDLYLLEGSYKGKSFFKVGRSTNARRRLEQHRRDCRCVNWKFFQFWKARHHISAERAVHKTMRSSGFVQCQKVCGCGRLHAERFCLPRRRLGKAWAFAVNIITRYL
ncbi:hypothetical protein V5O48_017719 [Marasmius crinis-equi]|uniref:Bacteriophage T5 Orf172 DNA-binding domain-containing protein n=1 Tax=Marasmius crinis-equi TaxID=585013 RepID=A0ABR3EN60_9AGAR